MRKVRKTSALNFEIGVCCFVCLVSLLVLPFLREMSIFLHFKTIFLYYVVLVGLTINIGALLY